MSTIINHQISGHNFHGRYGITLRGPAEGFILSARQLARYSAALCHVSGCQCGGGYGEGLDKGSARVEWVDFDSARLIPAIKEEF